MAESPQDVEGRQKLVQRLSESDLEHLTDAQLRTIDSIVVKRVNQNALERISKVMEGKEGDILRALTQAPYIYTSDEIEIFPGLKVQFASTLSSQEIDAKEAVNSVYSREETIDLAAARVNLISLVHGLSFVNGEPCGGVGLNPTQTDDVEHLKSIREKRMRFLRAQPAHLIDRLTEFHRAFQMQINSLTRDQKLLERVGN